MIDTILTVVFLVLVAFLAEMDAKRCASYKEKEEHNDASKCT